MADPFTIRIFVPDGDPEGVRIIDRMGWSGKALVFPRSKWVDAQQHIDVDKAGVYVLSGYTSEADNDELPTIYIGQGEVVRLRVDSHITYKDFWDRAILFVAPDGGLNKAHVAWLEHSLVKRAEEVSRCHLDNGNKPQEPRLADADKADTKQFLKEILRILPLAGFHSFEYPRAVATPASTSKTTPSAGEIDTIIVPAQKEGFESVFLGENRWRAIRISGGMLDKIKYIAAYQSQPTSAITHYAPVARIEPYGDNGKYQLIFAEKAQPLYSPVRLADAPAGAIQGRRYTSLAKLKTAKKISELMPFNSKG